MPIVSPTQLATLLPTASSTTTVGSHWAAAATQRLERFAAEGEWRADASSLVHALDGPSARRVQHWWYGDASLDDAAALDAAAAVCCEAAAGSEHVTFAALDTRLLPAIRAGLAGSRGLEEQWRSPCGVYLPASTSAAAAAPPPPLPPGFTLRSLRATDATLCNARWTYASAASEEMIGRCIARGLGCVGIEADAADALCGWVLRYEDGALGMLHVEPHARRLGLGRALVRRAAADIAATGKPCFAYIVDGNEASERLFAREGWTRAADVMWVGFGPREAEEG